MRRPRPVLLITPPMVQANTPYPAVPALTAFLRRHGAEAQQFDMSLAVACEVFSASGIRAILAAAAALPPRKRGAEVSFFMRHAERCEMLAGEARDFLRGAKPELAHCMARRGFFPEGPSFRELDPDGGGFADENLAALFGSAGVADRAKHLASLFLDDIALYARLALDPQFGLSRYAEGLAAAAPDFTPLEERLRAPQPSFVDALIERFTLAECARRRPWLVGVTAPFPGAVYGAFKVAECVRRLFPRVKTALGGGFVGTELRSMNDPRAMAYFDFICCGEGGGFLLDLCRKSGRAPQRVAASPRRRAPPERFVVEKPAYAEIDFTRHFPMLENANPMHRMWSGGRWLKLQLSHGCYWRRCAFCDTSLPYIRDFALPDAAQAADVICALMRETGIPAFHFTDEALAPALVSALCDELLRRRETPAWWGNIRFDAAFTPALAAKMRAAGCVAVAGGLECASARLLALMDKGVTLRGARRAAAAFAANGILVHAYLMYGFPTQTRREAVSALDFVRRLYCGGLVQSSYWHRFALTAHSPVAAAPERFGIRLLPPPAPLHRFALNEIPYEEPGAPDWSRIGAALRAANYNFMRGAGLDIPAREWLVHHAI